MQWWSPRVQESNRERSSTLQAAHQLQNYSWPTGYHQTNWERLLPVSFFIIWPTADWNKSIQSSQECIQINLQQQEQIAENKHLPTILIPSPTHFLKIHILYTNQKYNHQMLLNKSRVSKQFISTVKNKEKWSKTSNNHKFWMCFAPPPWGLKHKVLTWLLNHSKVFNSLKEKHLINSKGNGIDQCKRKIMKKRWFSVQHTPPAPTG